VDGETSVELRDLEELTEVFIEVRKGNRATHRIEGLLSRDEHRQSSGVDESDPSAVEQEVDVTLHNHIVQDLSMGLGDAGIETTSELDNTGWLQDRRFSARVPSKEAP
jgi:hypothetical protein